MKSFDYIPLYTYKDYIQWEGDWELINGHPHAMSPSPVRKHQLLAGKLSREAARLLESNTVCNDCEVFTDLDWIVNDETVVRPDLMIVCGDFKDDFLRFPPAMVIEILSPTTILKDRHIKFQLYQTQQVRYYIMVNPDTQTCEIFKLQNGMYIIADSLQEFALPGECLIQWNISDFVAQLKLD